MNESYGVYRVPPPALRPQTTNAHWGRRVLLAAVLVSLLVGGLAGGLIGGGATYLVLTWPGLRAAAETPATVPPQATLPAEAGLRLPASPAGVYDFAAVVDQVGPAVVTVVNQMQSQRDPFGSSVTPQASGSGVIIDPRGYIVTNYHVIEDAEELTVIFSDGTRLSAQIVGHDYPFSDLAVIKVDGDGYPYATLGDSDALRAGEPVVAIGSALGDFRNTVTTGVVSGLGRSLQVSTDVIMEGMIQTDAAINHGNSGGPLVNLQGEVVGINTAIIRGSYSYSGDVAEGLGFSIPGNTVRYVSEQLIAKGKVTRPYLGVRTTAVTRSMAAYYDLPVDHGVYVNEVIPGTPAAQADIREGDIIVRIGGVDIDEEHPLINVLSRFQMGQAVTLELNRGGRAVEVELVLGERP